MTNYGRDYQRLLDEREVHHFRGDPNWRAEMRKRARADRLRIRTRVSGRPHVETGVPVQSAWLAEEDGQARRPDEAELQKASDKWTEYWRRRGLGEF